MIAKVISSSKKLITPNSLLVLKTNRLKQIYLVFSTGDFLALNVSQPYKHRVIVVVAMLLPVLQCFQNVIASRTKEATLMFYLLKLSSAAMP